MSKLKTDASSWMKFNNDMLRHCEVVFVYMLPGWRESTGVTMERRIAKMLGIPVTFWNEDFSPNLEQQN